MVNVDLTPDVAVRLAAALGNALERGARASSRAGEEPGRVPDDQARDDLPGLASSTGVHVADLRVSPAAIARHLVKSEGHDAAFHVGVSPNDPEIVRIPVLRGAPGVEMVARRCRRRSRRALPRAASCAPRVAAGEVGGISYPARVHETYAAGLLATIDRDRVRERRFRIVVDYGSSGASYVLPLVLGPLGVEVVAAHAFAGETPEAPTQLPDWRLRRRTDRSGWSRRSARISGAVFRPEAAGRLHLHRRGGKGRCLMRAGATSSSCG